MIDNIAPHWPQRIGRAKNRSPSSRKTTGRSLLIGTRSPAAILSTMRVDTPASLPIWRWESMLTSSIRRIMRMVAASQERSGVGGCRPTITGGTRRCRPILSRAITRTRYSLTPRRWAISACGHFRSNRRSMPATTVAVIFRCRIASLHACARDRQRLTVDSDAFCRVFMALPSFTRNCDTRNKLSLLARLFPRPLDCPVFQEVPIQ